MTCLHDIISSTSPANYRIEGMVMVLFTAEMKSFREDGSRFILIETIAGLIEISLLLTRIGGPVQICWQ